MPPEIDPTQTGGQEETPFITPNPRNAVMAQIAQQAHKNVASELADFNEETGEVIPNVGEQAAPEPEVTGEGAETPPVVTPPAPKMMTIIVDGQPIDVEESRIMEAGKRTLQKDHAADRRLQEAAATKRQAEALLARAQQLSPQDTAHNERAPSQDAPQTTNERIALEPAQLDAYLENKLYIRDANKAAEKFWADFPEIASDPHLRNMAGSLEQQRLDTATALGESFGDPFEAYRKHGEAIKEWLKQKAGTPAPTPQSLDKQERKRTITAIPAVNARAPAPAAPKVLSTAEQIEAMRETRMRGRPVQRLQ